LVLGQRPVVVVTIVIVVVGHVRCLSWGVAAGAGTATWPPTAAGSARSRSARARPPGARWPSTSAWSTRSGAWCPTGPATSSTPLAGVPSHGRRHRCGGRCAPGSKHRYAHTRTHPDPPPRTHGPRRSRDGLQVAVHGHGQRGQVTCWVHHVGTHPRRPTRARQWSASVAMYFTATRVEGFRYPGAIDATPPCQTPDGTSGGE